MQASSSAGVSPSAPGTEADSAGNRDTQPGTDTVKADHSTNEGNGLEAGATSSSPRSTLAGGAVLAGEPMPISNTQISAPRVCCSATRHQYMCRHTSCLYSRNVSCFSCSSIGLCSRCWSRHLDFFAPGYHVLHKIYLISVLGYNQRLQKKQSFTFSTGSPGSVCLSEFCILCAVSK